MKISSILIALLLSLVTKAQNLQTFKAVLNPDSSCYLSISKHAAYKSSDAAEAKEILDLGLFKTLDAKKK